MPCVGAKRHHRKVAPGSHEEREKLLKAAGVTKERKAILLASAVAAVEAGLAAPGLTDRLRAASMALGLLGARPSRNPMASSPPADPGSPDAEAPSWVDAPAPGPPAVDPGDDEVEVAF